MNDNVLNALSSVFIIVLLFFGVLALILTVIFLILYIIKKTKIRKLIGLVSLVVSVLCLGYIYFHFTILLPKHSKKLEEKYLGEYTAVLDQLDTLGNEQIIKLNLKADRTYTLDTLYNFTVCKQGNWKNLHGMPTDILIVCGTNENEFSWLQLGMEGDKKIMTFNYIDYPERIVFREK